MTTQYTWIISCLECKPQVGDMTDYVVTAHWRCVGDDNEGHIGQCYSTVTFAIDPDKPNYVPYADITEEQAIQWVKDVLGEDQVLTIYASIDSQIESQANPPIVTPPLPWTTPLLS